MGNRENSETWLINDALDRIDALLPAEWRLGRTIGATWFDARRVDGIVGLVGPNATEVMFALEAKRSGAMPVSTQLAVLRELRRDVALPVLYVSDFIGPAVRSALAAEGMSYADATGWVRVTSSDPLILLTGHGATRAPRVPRATAITRFDGIAVSRTIRALLKAELPIGVRSLAAQADVSPGSVSKLLATLASEGIIDRDANGRVVAVRGRALLRRWTADYSFAKTNSAIGYFIAPRGIDRALGRLVDRTDVAVTGSAAARRMLPESSTPVVPLRLLAIYAERPAELAEELGLIDADPSTANVVIARPQDPDVIDRSDDDFPDAPLPLIIADLLTLPGRSYAEAEQLMNSLAIEDETWGNDERAGT